MARDKGCLAEPVDEAVADDGQEQDGAAAGGAPQAASAGPIQSREDAFRRLGEVSAYLRRTEPQSPVPLLIDRAISWGSLPFDQLLREMIKDESTRSQVSELLGLQSVDE
jgi:type VI secretion system protein ImpA